MEDAQLGRLQKAHLPGQQEGGVLGALPDVQRLILQAAADVLQLQLQGPHCNRSA